jgi:hypothetical protein
MNVVRMDDAWSDWRPDGMVHRPDGWNSGQMGVRTTGREPKTSVLKAVQNLLTSL